MEGLQTTWGTLIAVYLFLGGLCAGCFIATAMIALTTGERFKSTVRFGAWASTIAIAVGTLMLLIEVGKPFRALVLFKSFSNLQSWMAIGAWLVFGAILFNGLFALFWTESVLKRVGAGVKFLENKRNAFRTILAVLGIFLNLGVAFYTGVLLGVLPFRPFWNTWWLPALFTASALDTGMGLVTAYATLRERGEGAARLRKILEASVIALILIEGVVLGYYLHKMLQGSADAARAAQLLIGGAVSPVFWIIVVGLGLAVPLLVCLSQLSGPVKRATVVLPLLAITSCLLGGLALRFVVLWAGVPASLSSPSLMQILIGIRFVP
jgi:formate-dependent nitrite reductase membrane component NrfD